MWLACNQLTKFARLQLVARLNLQTSKEEAPKMEHNKCPGDRRPFWKQFWPGVSPPRPPFKTKRSKNTKTSVTWFLLPKPHIPSCLSAETQSNILWVLISWVFSLMPLFYSMFTLMLGFVRLSTDILTNRSLLLRYNRKKKHWEIKHCVGT